MLLSDINLKKQRTNAISVLLKTEHNERDFTTMKCLQCDADISDNFKFCPECGAKISRQCPNCKTPLNIGMKFCPECGVRLDAFTSVSEPAKANASDAPREVTAEENADELNKLGFRHYNGDGVAQDYSKAVELFRKAAEQGHADAQYNLGFYCHMGVGVDESDPEEALKWLRKAAEQGHASAQYTLGWFYDEGNRIEQDHSEAVKWYRNAAEQDDLVGQFVLGQCYEHGNGVVKDIFEAMQWYKKAAKQGNEEAKKALGRLKKGL